MNFLAQINNSLIEYDFSGLITDLKIISFFISIVFGFGFFYIIYKLRALIQQDLQMIATEVNPPKEPVSAYDTRWQEIKRHLQSVNQSEWKFAIIEADKLVDDVLKSAGYIGDSMGERMMSIEPRQLRSLDRLWRAHKIRNLLVHDANFELRRPTALEAIDGFESAIREMGGID